MTITQTLAAYREKQTTPSAEAQTILSRISERDRKLHAYLRTFEEEVRLAAARADQTYLSGIARPLEGICLAIKDNQLVTGTETTAASQILAGYKAPYTATAVRKLQEAGAIIAGKTNLDEFSMGSSTENSSYGLTRNPHNQLMVPGGSSGGSAAAVAAELCHGALGSDTGGSIREPASLCGVTGFKPSYGAVSRYGLIAMASSLDVIGPVTQTVADARLLFDVIRGKDEHDGTSFNLPAASSMPKVRDSLKGVRIGVPAEYFLPGIDSFMEGAIQFAIKELASLGAELVDISLPNTKYGLATYYIIMFAEASTNLARYDGVRYGPPAHKHSATLGGGYMAMRAKFGPEVRRRIMIGTYVLSAGYYDAYYRQAQKVRGLISKDINDSFSRVDVIISPTSPNVAWPIGEKVHDPLTMYLSDIFTVTANLSGVPAISIPCGTVDNLPVGLQFMGKRGEDEFLLDVAEVFQKHLKPKK